jgi:hypothetical protein
MAFASAGSTPEGPFKGLEISFGWLDFSILLHAHNGATQCQSVKCSATADSLGMYHPVDCENKRDASPD